MRKIIVSEFVSMDGVMQAAGGPDDIADGFQYGGWSAPYIQESDDATEAFLKKYMKPSSLLLGRKTFEGFASFWPTHGDLWPGVNEIPKYAVSTTLDKSDWNNSSFLKNVDDIKNLKNSDGANLEVHGSGDLVQTLLKHDLVDELWLKILPITLGQGKKLFGEGTTAAAFVITDSFITANGVILAHYKRSGEVKTGNMGG